eukprot:tig00000147_g9502.t1
MGRAPRKSAKRARTEEPPADAIAPGRRCRQMATPRQGPRAVTHRSVGRRPGGRDPGPAGRAAGARPLPRRPARLDLAPLLLDLAPRLRRGWTCARRGWTSRPACGNLAGLSDLGQCARLRSLYLGVGRRLWTEIYDLDGHLSPVSRLRSLETLEIDVPLPVAALEALAPLWSTLRSLRFLGTVESASIGFYVEAAARLRHLERLGLLLCDTDGSQYWPSPGAGQLAPLTALRKLRVLDLGVVYDSLEVLRGLPPLAHFSAYLDEPAAEPSASAIDTAASLRSLWLACDRPAEAEGRLRVARLLRQTLRLAPGLQALELMLHPDSFEDLAADEEHSEVFGALASLEKLVLSSVEGGGGGALPWSFLQRFKLLPSLRCLKLQARLVIVPKAKRRSRGRGRRRARTGAAAAAERTVTVPELREAFAHLRELRVRMRSCQFPWKLALCSKLNNANGFAGRPRVVYEGLAGDD